MLTDLVIAQTAKMVPIGEIASQLGILEDELDLLEYTRQKSSYLCWSG